MTLDQAIAAAKDALFIALKDASELESIRYGKALNFFKSIPTDYDNGGEMYDVYVLGQRTVVGVNNYVGSLNTNLINAVKYLRSISVNHLSITPAKDILNKTGEPYLIGRFDYDQANVIMAKFGEYGYNTETRVVANA